jgi:hypothetical protein
VFKKFNLAEAKVKATALVSGLAVAALMAWLGSTGSDLIVKQLPDGLEVPALGVLAYVLTFLAGYKTRSTEGKLAPSTLDAAEAWLRKYRKI